jgi:hypothetical protein
MENSIFETLIYLSKKHPNDFEFGSKVRDIVRQFEKQDNSKTIVFEMDYPLQTKLNSEEEKWKPTEEEISKLEEFLSNLKTNEDGI